MSCRWIVREGRGFAFWAFTTCKKGFNPLSRVNDVKYIKPYYDGRMCPICGEPIKCDISLVNDDMRGDTDASN